MAPACRYSSRLRFAKGGIVSLCHQGKLVRDAEKVLRDAAKSGLKEGIACSYEVSRWEVVKETIAFIRHKAIKRVILGTSSRGKLGKFFLGSIAEELIRTVEVPVCTIGPQLRIPTGAGPAKIPFAMSLNHNLDLTFQFAEDLASKLDAELTVLHVLDEADLPMSWTSRSASAHRSNAYRYVG